MEVSELSELNATVSIDSRELLGAKVTDRKFRISQKAPYPMWRTVDGITTLVTEVPWNAPNWA